MLIKKKMKNIFHQKNKKYMMNKELRRTKLRMKLKFGLKSKKRW